jgi:polar amino acid transport system substrate-binding protein
MQIESGYLVRGDAIKRLEDVDRAGVRIVVVERGDSDIFLTKLLKEAKLTRVKAIPEAVELLKTGGADVHANIKTFLIPTSKQVPDGRILDGYWQIQPIAFGVPKGKAGADFVRRTMSELKASGFTKESVQRANVPGLMAAP